MTLTDKLLQYYRECLWDTVDNVRQVAVLTPITNLIHNIQNKCVGYAISKALYGLHWLKKMASPCLTKCMFIYFRNRDKQWLEECVDMCMDIYGVKEA